jgi:hypothetical protein
MRANKCGGTTYLQMCNFSFDEFTSIYQLFNSVVSGSRRLKELESIEEKDFAYIRNKYTHPVVCSNVRRINTYAVFSAQEYLSNYMVFEPYLHVNSALN